MENVLIYMIVTVIVGLLVGGFLVCVSELVSFSMRVREAIASPVTYVTHYHGGAGDQNLLDA